jgi:hypothetical protein
MALAGNTLVRHLVSGDWLTQRKDGRKVLDRKLIKSVIALHEKASWLTGWGYTHAAKEWTKAKISPSNLPSNLHILASCETAEQKAEHNADGWRTARVIQEASEKLPDEVLCPFDAQKRKGVPSEKRTNCARCKLCFASNKNIAFWKS